MGAHEVACYHHRQPTRKKATDAKGLGDVPLGEEREGRRRIKYLAVISKVTIWQSLAI